MVVTGGSFTGMSTARRVVRRMARQVNRPPREAALMHPSSACHAWSPAESLGKSGARRLRQTLRQHASWRFPRAQTKPPTRHGHRPRDSKGGVHLAGCEPQRGTSKSTAFAKSTVFQLHGKRRGETALQTFIHPILPNCVTLAATSMLLLPAGSEGWRHVSVERIPCSPHH